MTPKKDQQLKLTHKKLKLLLSEKNAELKIEHALEKVRAIALRMKEPADMLKICRAISLQLEKLGVKEIRNVQTAIFNEPKSFYTNYEYYAKHDKLLITEVDYTNHDVPRDFANRMLGGPNQVWMHGFKGKEVKEWLKYQRSTNVFIDSYLKTADSLNYYWYSLGPVALGCSTYIPLKEEEIELFKRFRNVFELAYRRYLDIQKAEAQAREAEIQLALERVRAVSMAMHQSDELTNVCEAMFKELTALGFTNIRNAQVAIANDEHQSYSTYVYSPFEKITAAQANYNSSPLSLDVYRKLGKSSDGFYEKQFSKNEMKQWRAWRKKLSPLKDPREETVASLCWYMYSVEKGHIGISTFNPLKEEEIEIVKRFKNVFALSYRRFVDLQNAEAQARESQIELGLERVRARAMAMQTSEELNALIGIVFTELTKLDLVLTRCVIIIYDAETKGAQWWMANSEAPSAPMNFFVKYANLSFFNTYIQGWEERDLKWQYILEGENKIVTDNFLFNETELKTLPGFVIEGMKAPHKVYLNASFNNFGNLTLATLEPLSEKHFDILLRFAKVFDLTYTRFNDLQKAEAQVRESQIQLALERVRARTMAMQKSNELAETALLLFQQLQHLGLKFSRTGFYIWKKDADLVEGWTSNGALDEILPSLLLPFKEDKGHREIYEASLKGELSYEQVLTGDELKKHYQWLMAQPTAPGTLKKLNESEYVMMDIQFKYAAIFKEGYLLLIAETSQPDASELLKRFAKVFDQTYTRFNDLKQAEEQARESQIQLALERVRARTMAMQKSDELSEAVYILFQQFRELGENPDQATIGVINEKEQVIEYWVTMYGNQMNKVFKFSVDEPNVTNKIYKAWKENKKSLVIDLKGKKLLEFMTYRAGKGGAAVNPDEKRRIINVAFFSKGLLNVQSNVERSEESIKLLERFAAVFEQTYTRFLDLQKAEAQAREAQIEAALERVRSRSMAMHKSDELLEVINVVSEQLQQLKIRFGFVNFGFLSDNGDLDFWLSSPGFPKPERIHMPFVNNPITTSVMEAKQKEIRFFTNLFTAKETSEWIKIILENNPASRIMTQSKDVLLNSPGFARTAVLMKDINIFLGNFASKPFTDEQNTIIIRFAKVFEQTYTRFLDLQKAEAQAREAKIETALERIRSRSIAMQKSSELKEVIQIVYEQFIHLNIHIEHTGFLMDYKTRDDMHIWLADQHLAPSEVIIPFFDAPPNNSIKEAKEKGQDSFKYLLNFEEKNKFYQDIFKFVPDVPEETLQYYFNCPGLAGSGVLLDNIGLYIENFDGIPYTDEENKILMRFGNVFQQTYTRFLDLQKAEAQAREAQIQLALERVRAKTMAMQRPQELDSVIKAVYSELKQLDVSFYRCFIMIFDEQKGATWWMGSPDDELFHQGFYVQYHAQPPHLAYLKGWEERQQKWEYFLSGQIKRDWDKFIFNKTELSKLPPMVIHDMKSYEFACLSASFENFGCITTGGMQGLSQESYNILSRFAKVFDITYTRFLDLQKAEAQAREAEIQLALERVRARTMAMQKQNDLLDVLHLLVEQLVKLGVHLEIANFSNGIPNENWDLWIEVVTDDGTIYNNYVHFPRIDHPYFHHVEKNIEIFRNRGTDLFKDVFSKEEKDSWQDYVNTQTVYKDITPQEHRQIIYNKTGYTWSMILLKDTWVSICRFNTVPFSNEEDALFRRFANAFGQAYTRFLDLQKAEAQAKEAKIEAALEKVRSRTLAMQKSNELAETSAVLFQQLIHLGISPNRLYISIVKDDTGETEFWITDEDGSKVSMAYQDNLNNNPSFKKMYDGWKHQEKSLVIDMTDEELQEYLSYLSSIHVPFKGGLSQKRRVQYLAYFSKGFIGMASPEPQPAETLQLLERFAYVFNLTFTRFNDLQIAEAHALQAEQDLIAIKAARKKAEETLTELQATQKQLIQSEKMASLGELTAGIAHEIQNPLNFVNNFSEVNKELIEELKNEKTKLKSEEIDELLNDIAANEEKINHHGKRADAIVKGMLQHSRTSSGQKELTNINTLCDEYLRLSYHGLRAKDKSFNAEMKTDFDETIGKINVVPQEIGRVILNLINNAFYAVSERQKREGEGYKPMITIQTRKADNRVCITVSDNGNGIPQNILDKIFQPFFTTKPTGSGTGLGLSLSYDIVKAHGGEIKVETKEGEGSEFIIQLPIQIN